MEDGSVIVVPLWPSMPFRIRDQKHTFHLAAIFVFGCVESGVLKILSECFYSVTHLMRTP